MMRPNPPTMPHESPPKKEGVSRASPPVALPSSNVPNAAIKTFIERYADPCQVSGNVITLRPNGVRTCDNGENNVVDPLEFVCSNCLLADIGISVSQVGTMATVTAGLAMSFEGLKIN